ncbi:hypothetical protein [Klebsiella pneumoniae]|uniref:hypothetical protein n=1 Tax=Klebsiella pneumoniae TaxID=573 RepID=UPI003B9C3720
MTSKLTRERLQEIAEDGFLKHGESKELARMALAAMDIEPVILYRQVNPTNGMKTYWAELDPEEFRHLKKYTDENAEFMTLYRHTQPALTGNFPIIGIDLASGPDRAVEVRYVAPPGYVMVPKEPTREMLDEFDSIIDYGAEDSQDAWRRLLAATPQEVK